MAVRSTARTGGVEFNPLKVLATPVMYGHQLDIRAIVSTAQNETLMGNPTFEILNLGTNVGGGQLQPDGPFQWKASPVISTLPTHVKITVMFGNQQYQVNTLTKSTLVELADPNNLPFLKTMESAPVELTDPPEFETACKSTDKGFKIKAKILSGNAKTAHATRWDCEGDEIGEEEALDPNGDKTAFSKTFDEPVAFAKVRVQFEGSVGFTKPVVCQDCNQEDEANKKSE